MHASSPHTGYPIHWAVGHATTKYTLEVLVHAGANVNAGDENGCTPIMLACMRDQPEMVELLIYAGAKLDIFAHNLSPLAACCVSGSLRCAKMVVEKDKSVCLLRDPVDKLLPVEVAVHAGHPALVEYLTPLSNVEAKNPHQWIMEQAQQNKEEEQRLHEQSQQADNQALVAKEQGNRLFKSQRYAEAAQEYIQAIETIPHISARMHATLLTNASLCYFKLEKLDTAKHYAVQAIQIDSSYVKAHHRLAQTCASLNDHESAARAAWDGYSLQKESKEGLQCFKLFEYEVKLARAEYQKS